MLLRAQGVRAMRMQTRMGKGRGWADGSKRLRWFALFLCCFCASWWCRWCGNWRGSCLVR